MSVTRQTGVYDELELDAPGSRLEPARLVCQFVSSFFDNPGRFPPGTVVPVSAFVSEGFRADGGRASRWLPVRPKG